MNNKTLHDLARTFEPQQIKQRRGPQGRDLDYIETHNVIARLNSVLAGDWSFEIVEHRRLGDEVVVLGRLSVHGQPEIIKTAFGSSRADGSPGDDLKAAASDALKKAATLLGVALHLYDRDGPREVKDSREQPQTAPDRQVRGGTQSPRVTHSQLAKIRELVAEVRGVEWRVFRDQLRESRGVNPEFLSRRAASDLLSSLIEEARQGRRQRGAA